MENNFRIAIFIVMSSYVIYLLTSVQFAVAFAGLELIIVWTYIVFFQNKKELWGDEEMKKHTTQSRGKAK